MGRPVDAPVEQGLRVMETIAVTMIALEASFGQYVGSPIAARMKENSPICQCDCDERAMRKGLPKSLTQ